MPFAKAKACFSENMGLINVRTSDRNETFMFNLNAGLHNLTTALESRLSEIDRRLSVVESSLRNLK